MLTHKIAEDGFKLYYKDYLFLNHKLDDPCIIVGKGKGLIKMRNRGLGFKIKEKDVIKIPLESFSISQTDNSEIIIDFKGKEEQLNCIFKIVNKRLEISFSPKNADLNRFSLKLHAFEDEAIYGCGEQFSELNLKGKDVPLWVEEQGVGRGDPPISGDWYTTYIPQPTFVSSNNYYVHSESTSYAVFKFSNPNYHELNIWEIPQKLVIGKFETALETISHLSSLLGRQPKLADWVYNGAWLGIQGGEDIVREKVNKCLEKGVKVGAVWCQDWQGVNIIGISKRLLWNWEYDEVLYPDLPLFIEELNKKGIKFLGYINSMLAPNGNQYQEAIEKELYVKDKDGNPYDVKTDSGNKILLDLSNPDTIDWLKQTIKENMIGVGLSGWMSDYGEYLATNTVLHSGEDPEKFHNKYPVMFAKANLDAVSEAGKLGEVVFFSRAGYTGISRYSTQIWAGDQLVNWSMHDGLATVIPAGISSGICGIGYFHYDIGGFHSSDNFVRDKEVFMRWAEMATFTITMRTHESIRPTTNWQFDSDDETLEFFAKMTQRFTHLKPYLKHLSDEYVESGIPPFRAPYLHYEKDPELHEIKYQYLLGKDLMIAPVFKPGMIEWEVYLPDDTWIHLWSGKEFGKGWKKVKAPIGKPPVFYRKDSAYSKLFRELNEI